MNSTFVGRSLRGYSSSGMLGWMTRSAIWTLQSMKKPRSGGSPSEVRISSAARCASAKTRERTIQCSERFRTRPSAEDDGASPRPKGAVSTEDSESGDAEKTTLGRPRLSATSGPDRNAPSATHDVGPHLLDEPLDLGHPAGHRAQEDVEDVPPQSSDAALDGLRGRRHVVVVEVQVASDGPVVGPGGRHGGAERAAGVPRHLVPGLDQPAGQREGRVHVAGGRGRGDEYASHGSAFPDGSEEWS